MKFKVGDKVKVVRVWPIHAGWISELNSYVCDGKEYVISKVHGGDGTYYLGPGHWWFPEESLELAEENNFNITTKITYSADGLVFDNKPGLMAHLGLWNMYILMAPNMN